MEKHDGLTSGLEQGDLTAVLQALQAEGVGVDEFKRLAYGPITKQVAGVLLDDRKRILTFQEAKKIKGLVVIGPKEINRIFGTDYPLDIKTGFYLDDIQEYVKQISRDFIKSLTSPKVCLVFFTDKDGDGNVLNLAALMDKFDALDAVSEKFFPDGEKMLGTAVKFGCGLFPIEQNPAYTGKDFSQQKKLALMHDETIINVAEECYRISVLWEISNKLCCNRTNNRTFPEFVKESSLVEVNSNDSIFVHNYPTATGEPGVSAAAGKYRTANVR